MRRWVQNLIQQFNFDWQDGKSPSEIEPPSLSDDRATLLFILDTYNKHLMEIDGYPVRKVREILDEFAKELLNPESQNIDKILFRLRQFFTSYRIAEHSYLQKTFDEFRGIIWDFVDQLAEDLSAEQLADNQIRESLTDLREAVESNSIETLKQESRKFIDSYVEFQTKRDMRKTARLQTIKQNLVSVRQQLFEAKENLMVDHLTKAFNRRSFDERVKEHLRVAEISQSPLSLIVLDIDHFKKINDTYGHPIGDFVLQECVALLQNVFARKEDMVARIGGEEFAILLPDHRLEHAVTKAEEVLAKVRRDVFVHEGHELRFTVSMGVAQWNPGEKPTIWLERADKALYQAKNTGRNRYIVALMNGVREVA